MGKQNTGEQHHKAVVCVCGNAHDSTGSSTSATGYVSLKDVVVKVIVVDMTPESVPLSDHSMSKMNKQSSPPHHTVTGALVAKR